MRISDWSSDVCSSDLGKACATATVCLGNSIGAKRMSSSNLLKGIFCSVAGALFATTAWASDAHVAPMTDYAKSTVKQWISDATVIEAVKDRKSTRLNSSH